MAAAGQQAMTQKQLNKALWYACSFDNDFPLVAELLDRGALRLMSDTEDGHKSSYNNNNKSTEDMGVQFGFTSVQSFSRVVTSIRSSPSVGDVCG